MLRKERLINPLHRCCNGEGRSSVPTRGGKEKKGHIPERKKGLLQASFRRKRNPNMAEKEGTKPHQAWSGPRKPAKELSPWGSREDKNPNTIIDLIEGGGKRLDRCGEKRASLYTVEKKVFDSKPEKMGGGGVLSSKKKGTGALLHLPKKEALPSLGGEDVLASYIKGKTSSPPSKGQRRGRAV